MRPAPGPLGLIPGQTKPLFFDAVMYSFRVSHCNIRTKRTYADRIKRFSLFQNRQHLLEIGSLEINQLKTYLAAEGHVAASTRSHAFSASFFLYPYQKVPKSTWAKMAARRLDQRRILSGSSLIVRWKRVDRRLWQSLLMLSGRRTTKAPYSVRNYVNRDVCAELARQRPLIFAFQE